MPKPTRLTDDDLKALTDAEMQDAQSYCGDGSVVSMSRIKNKQYFLGLPVGDLTPPAIDGRSKVVDTTVRNTILGMEGPLLKTFCGTDDVVEFTARTPDDEAKARQATDYINHVLRVKNPGYRILSTWMRDALEGPVGVLKVWWDDSAIESQEEYRGQTAEQLAILLDDDEIEVTGQKSYPDPEAEKARARTLEQMQAQLGQMLAQVEAAAQTDPMAAVQGTQAYMQAQAQFEEFAAQPVPELFDIIVKRTKTGGKLCVDNVPPDEFLISRRAKSLEDTTFVGHRVRRTINQLSAAGYENVDELTGEDVDGSEALTRNWLSADDSSNSISFDRGNRSVWITECYVFADVDATGVAEWWKIVRGEGEILEKTQVDGHPFVDIHSLPLPHVFFGMCPADLAREHQRIKTSLKRAALDNIYMQVNGRYYAVKGQVNLDDLLTSKPGGVVRVDNPQSVGRLDQGNGDTAGAMALMESIELDAEESTGWTRQSQGGNGLNLSNTATQANIITNRADSRVEVIARNFAETGFTSLFRKMLKLITQYQDKAEQVKLGNEWANIDPREWTNGFDLTINVGLGTGNKDQQVQHLMALNQQQQFGLTIGTATPENVFNAQAKLTSALGFRNAEQFFTNPKNAPAQAPAPDPNIVKAQLDDQRHQREMQAKQQQAQMDRDMAMETERMKAEAQMQVDRNRQQLEADQQAMKIQLEAEQAERDAQRRHAEQLEKMQLEREKMALEQYKAELAQNTAIVIAQTRAQQVDPSLVAAEQAANNEVADGQ